MSIPTPAELYQVTISRRPASVLIALAGEIDALCHRDLNGVLVAFVERLDEPFVTVDLSAVDFMDSSGLNLLMALQRALGPRGQLRVEGVPSQLRQLFKVTGAAVIFGILENDSN